MSTPTVNPLNFRFPFDIEGKAHDDVVSAIRYCFTGLIDINQALPYLKKQVDSTTVVANAASSATVAGVSSFNSETGAVVYFPNLGTVNDQLGQSSYETQQSDNGGKIIVGDSSAVTIFLNNSVTAPWFAIIDNDSSTMAILSPAVGASLFGEQSIPPGGFGIVAFDGTNFWSGATVVATDSSLGYVQPDDVTIGIDSGLIYTQVEVDSGPPGYTPGTPGNPFYFDSTASPWHGYVWWGGNWNRFS